MCSLKPKEHLRTLATRPKDRKCILSIVGYVELSFLSMLLTVLIILIQYSFSSDRLPANDIRTNDIFCIQYYLFIMSLSLSSVRYVSSLILVMQQNDVKNIHEVF